MVTIYGLNEYSFITKLLMGGKRESERLK